jgi:hypothetical protein
MRHSLKQSLADSAAGDQVDFRYPKGSVVLCNACARPMAILEQGIPLGARCGRMVSAIAPLSVAQLVELGDRDDIDAGVRAFVKGLTPEQLTAHAEKGVRFTTGDPMICPYCAQCFVQVLSVEKHETLDKAYVIELVTLPPKGHKVLPVRGLELGADKGWLHEHARIVH